MFVDFDQVDWNASEAAEFAAYWRSLANVGELPRQSDFDPAAVRSLLPGISIYEQKDNGEYVCRLMGTQLVDKFGAEATGRNMLEMWREDIRDEIKKTMKLMVEHPCGVMAALVGHTVSGIKVTASVVGFPALDGDGLTKRTLFHTNGIESSKSRIAREDRVQHMDMEIQALISLN